MCRQFIRLPLVLGTICAATACHGILDTTNPLLVRDKDLTNPSGAEGRRSWFIYSWQDAFQRTAHDVALFTDEESIDLSPDGFSAQNPDIILDTRDTAGMQSANVAGQDDPYLHPQTQAFWLSTLAIEAQKKYGSPTLKEDYVAELFALRGHIALQLAETMCAGFPLNDVTTDGQPLFGTALTTDSALHYAAAQFDSVFAHVKDSTQFANLGRVLKGRALLDLGQYAAAAAAVQEVPDNFVYVPELISGNINPFVYGELINFDPSSQAYFLSDGEGGNGLHYVSEHDTIRAPNVYLQQRNSEPADSMFVQNIYRTGTTPIPVASGREARLIRMEAAYQAGDPSWFTTLNALRTEAGLTAILAVPATDTGKVNLIFHERAFWLLRTGHRLGDMRRLISRYGRAPESVFPTGDYAIFDLKYGAATALHFVTQLQTTYNPHITHGCTAP